MNHPMTQGLLIREVAATFPGADPRSAAETVPSRVRINGHALMADGFPLLSAACMHEEYDGEVHDGFNSWLELRGWYAAPGDRGDVVLSPVSIVAIAIERLNAAWWQPVSKKELKPGECPF